MTATLTTPAPAPVVGFTVAQVAADARRIMSLWSLLLLAAESRGSTRGTGAGSMGRHPSVRERVQVPACAPTRLEGDATARGIVWGVHEAAREHESTLVLLMSGESMRRRPGDAHTLASVQAVADLIAVAVAEGWGGHHHVTAAAHWLHATAVLIYRALAMGEKPTNPVHRELLSAAECAGRLGVSRAAVSHAKAAGRITPVTGGVRPLYDWVQVRNAFSGGASAPVAED